MELSKEQIERLFQFTKKKYVHWYDLQAELVDHLATRIEEEQVQNPALDFERALAKVYDGFGIFGFAHIVQQKSAQLERSSRRLWWRSFREFFGWPKIVLLAASLWLLWQLAHQFPGIFTFGGFVVAFLVSEIQLWRYRLALRKASRPLLLLELSPLRYTSGFFFFQFIESASKVHPTGLFVFGVISLLCVLINIASYRAHKRVQAEAEALYPEAFAKAW
ncbi:hypothetical protein EPD60_04005 [Flaviaesturariibacter flavus]|uniref:Uncharacterized protein n=1 Tax=Flaviaesturariibacter flavus TaxID=2502780 RepID=A0A4V2NWT7_9BACT|nr:hypothetical protein [Flaviaesturariibacter flavus]TCJ18672.1 hypothetical protein EPD60_04005 [Flaviaesturariibacter flavus]